MISDICQTAIDKNPDRTKVEDIHNQCSGILSSGEKRGCDCHLNSFLGVNCST